MASEKILEQKKKEVSEVVDLLKQSTGIVISEYQGIKVDQDTTMRKEMRESGVTYKVVKNAILLHAFKEMGYEGVEDFLKGPSAISCSEDPVAPSKVLSKYAKEYDAIKVKVGVLDGEVIDTSRIEKLATLPSREELIAKVVGGISAPLYGLANVLNGNIKGLVVALSGLAKQRQEAEA